MGLRRIIAAGVLGAWACGSLRGQDGAATPGGLPWVSFEEPQFPGSLAPTAVTDGYAIVAFTFDESGVVTDWVALEASHPAFSSAVFVSLRSSRLDTARHQPVIMREIVRFDFRRTGAVVSKTHRDSAKTAFTTYGDERATALRTVSERELSPPLRTIEAPMPDFPDSLRGRGVRARVTVDFVIDAEGRVRVPVVIGAAEPELRTRVLAAVGSWQFNPPLQGGAPVQVIVQRSFLFGPKESASR